MPSMQAAVSVALPTPIDDRPEWRRDGKHCLMCKSGFRDQFGHRWRIDIRRALQPDASDLHALTSKHEVDVIVRVRTKRGQRTQKPPERPGREQREG